MNPKVGCSKGVTLRRKQEKQHKHEQKNQAKKRKKIRKWKATDHVK